MTLTPTLARTRERPTSENAVLILVDLQVGPLWEIEFRTFRHRVAALAHTASSLGMPTVVSTTAAEEWGPIIPEITAASSGTVVLERTVTNAWDDPCVRRAVEFAGRNKLIIAGASTEFSVTPCALSALDAGYEVYVAHDALRRHDHRSVLRMLHAGVFVADCLLLLAAMIDDGDQESRRVHGLPTESIERGRATLPAERRCPTLRAIG